jgi:uncharacterized protein
MKNHLILVASFAFMCSSSSSAEAQSTLYPQLFNYSEVTLNDGIFKTAEELNYSVLLQYDVDRLLTPFFRQAGMTDWEVKHPNFDNWGSGSFRLDGHVGGHYLTALALAYASCQDAGIKLQLKERLDYMVHQMDSCQSKFDSNESGLYGYIGGLPYNNVWTDMYSGNVATFRTYGGNVPFYVMHKIIAGMRDAYVFGNNTEAKKCYLKLCDWAVNVISNIDDNTLQSILGWEHGGINEPLLDAYQITGLSKYLTTAKRYCHKEMITGMQTLNTTFLDNKHANTQVPKYIGFERIAQQDATSTDKSLMAQYRKAAQNFWTDVTTNRTLALGGNSIDEHFLPAANCSNYITNPNGPESCNSNNMLKLSEDLFADNHNAKYVDFYEKAMLNHILSTQNPTTGGYVYFTSLRPQHYRVYSQVNQAMWCCVGTGMENHSKYGEFTYTHVGTDSLFVNLFIPSTLNNSTFGLEQKTKFPYEQQTIINVTKAGKYVMAIRHPEWCTGNYQITINGIKINDTSKSGSFAYINRSWNAGDVITVSLPMQLQLIPCPNYTNYIAFRYGPVLLAAKTGTDNLTGLFAGEGRMDHAAGGAQLSLTSAPMLIGDRSTVLDSFYCVNKDSLKFKIKAGLYNNNSFKDLILEPFFQVHEARYMMYWQQLSASQWEQIKAEVIAEEKATQKLNERTLDFVSTGEQQSDAGHSRTGNFGTGVYNGEYYIDAQSGNSFSYQLETKGQTNSVSLMCRYTTADLNRVMTIYVDGKKLTDVKITNQTTSGFYNVEYPIDSSLLKKSNGMPKDTITVMFKATGTTPTPGLYYLRLLKGYVAPATKTLPKYAFIANQWISGDEARVNSITYDTSANTITVNGKSGSNNIALQFNKNYSDSSYVKLEQKYFLIKGTPLKTTTGSSYLWWLNGANHGSQVAPTYSVTDASGDNYIIWDITTSGINDNMMSDSILISTNNASFITVFGLTSNASNYAATIKDINFYTAQQAVDTYPVLSSSFGIEPSAVKTINITSDNDNRIYTIDGRHADTNSDKMPKGIYILNGKKIIIK